MKLSIILHKIANGYLAILLKILFILAFLSVAAIAAMLVGYPLWIFAAHYTQTYNLFVATIIASVIIGMIILKLFKTVKTSYRGNYRKFFRQKLTQVMLVSFRTFVTLILVYIFIFVLLNYGLVISLVAAPLITVAIGITLFVK